MLAWIFERCAGRGSGHETPIGTMPVPEHLDLTGLELPEADVRTLLSVDREGWLHEIPMIREYYAQFAVKLPADLSQELDQLEQP